MSKRKPMMPAPIRPSIADWWDQLSSITQGIVKIGAAFAMIYGVYIWGSDKIVWAEQFEQTVADFNCQFADIKRTQLEGQAADTQFRINQMSGRKVLSPDDARDLAALNVRLSNIQNQINRLPDCSQQSRSIQRPQQPRR